MEKQQLATMIKFVLLASFVALAISHGRLNPDGPGNSPNIAAQRCYNDNSSYCNIMGGRCHEQCPEDYDFGVECKELCGHPRCKCCYMVEAQEGDPCGDDGLGTCTANCNGRNKMVKSDCPGGQLKCCVDVQQDGICHQCIGHPDFCNISNAEVTDRPCVDGSYCCQCVTGKASLCISAVNNWCNGVNDCLSGIDEDNCPSDHPRTPGCGDTRFLCDYCF